MQYQCTTAPFCLFDGQLCCGKVTTVIAGDPLDLSFPLEPVSICDYYREEFLIQVQGLTVRCKASCIGGGGVWFSGSL